MNIGERIKYIRNSKKKSTYDISELTGIPQSTISKLENNKRKADYEMLKSIAEALDVSVDRLSGESVSCLIEDRLEEIGMALPEVARKANVPLHWLQNLDTFIPGEWGDKNDIAYKWINQVGEVLGLPDGLLRAALARQEVPAYDGPTSSPEEDFGFDEDEDVTRVTHKTDEYINDLKDSKIDPKLRPIIDSLDRAGDLQDEDIDEIAKQVEFLINLKRKKK